MNRKNRRIGIGLLLLLLLLVPLVWITYREFRQARLDYALIEAVKAGEDKKILAALAEGASGEARDMGKPPTVKEAWQHLLDRFRHSSTPSVGSPNRDEHLSALLLLYHDPGGSFGKLNVTQTLQPELRMVRALLDHGAKVNDQDSLGISPLRYAAAWSVNAEDVRLLLARGANTELADSRGFTPLLAASTARSAEVLLEHGANIEAVDATFRRTALMWAVSGGRSDEVRILLQHGASVSPKDINGKTALDLVGSTPFSRLEAHQIAVLLRQYGAK